jgi:Secretion system C-terminal sorting domain
MKKVIPLFFAGFSLLKLTAQNLVTNPDAESLPTGAGWTIISQGALTCINTPTNTISNWTLKPIGTANYPYDHTTGANGGTVFFSGCDTYFQGPFELQQNIDVSADAALIDLGTELYTFSGYMQTPVTNQTDQGRFIVDFLNSSNAILGTSYNSGWQSYFTIGIAWKLYADTRIAPAGTRTIRIRLQTQLLFNQPAINVYFDDISLTKPIILPVNLLSFTGKEIQGSNYLHWTMPNDPNLQRMELELSYDGSQFNRIGSFAVGNSSYDYTDQYSSNALGKYFYRLRLISTNGQIMYSNILLIKSNDGDLISLSPNPAKNIVLVNGNFQKSTISLINYSGQTVLSIKGTNPQVRIDVSRLPAGIYFVRIHDEKNMVNKKLLVQHP